MGPPSGAVWAHPLSQTELEFFALVNFAWEAATTGHERGESCLESKPPRSHVDFERRASSGLSYDGGCSGGLLWHRVFALAQSLPFPWQHFMQA
jgi:hypothetical protein